jgi:hypothetical protein
LEFFLRIPLWENPGLLDSLAFWTIPASTIAVVHGSTSFLNFVLHHDGGSLPGDWEMVLEKKKARRGRNPATGESIKIPAKRAGEMWE